MAKRFDFFNIRDLKNVKKTDQGFLKLPIRATRTGVFKYLNKDGTIRRELRHPDEVFNADSMATLAGVPLTYTHPDVMVDAKNNRSLSIGWTGDSVLKSDEKFLDVPGTITDERIIAQVEKKALDGMSQEVSCGYNCELEFTPGVFEGENYDAIQRNIRYNHVALVDRGRAGSEVRLKLDSDDAVLDNGVVEIYKEFPMKKITIDGKEFEVNADVAEAFETFHSKKENEVKELKEKNDSLEVSEKEITKKLDETEAKKDSLELELKTSKEEIEKAKKESKMDHAEIDKLVQERASVCNVAEKIIKEFKKDCKSNLEIKKEVIGVISPEIKLDEKSEDYINARFDAIAEKSDLFTDHLKKVIENKLDADEVNKNKKEIDAKAAREASMKADSEAWKLNK